MKLALIGAVAVAAAAFATPVLAQAEGSAYRGGQAVNAASHSAAGSGAPRYHGGPKSSD